MLFRSVGGDVGQKNGLWSMDASFTFRARSHDELMEWWNDCKQLSKVYRALDLPSCLAIAAYS